MIPTKTLDDFETAIDKHGIDAVLDGIAAICDDKADRIEGSYSDRALAYCWWRIANRLREIDTGCAN